MSVGISSIPDELTYVVFDKECHYGDARHLFNNLTDATNHAKRLAQINANELKEKYISKHKAVPDALNKFTVREFPFNRCLGGLVPAGISYTCDSPFASIYSVYVMV
jgi:hypothetical protein